MNSNTARALSNDTSQKKNSSASLQTNRRRATDRQSATLSLVPRKAYPQLVGDAAVRDAMLRTG